MTEKERVVLERFGKYITKKGVSNDFLLELIQLTGSFLNLQTIADYARAKHLSYQGVKTCRKIIILFGCKFVLDND